MKKTYSMILVLLLPWRASAAGGCAGNSTLEARNRAEIEEATANMATFDEQVAALKRTQQTQYLPLKAKLQDFNAFIDRSENKRQESFLILTQVQALLERLALVGSSVSEIDNIIATSISVRPEQPISFHFEAALNLVSLTPDDRNQLVSLLQILKAQERADRSLVGQLRDVLARADGANQKYLEPLLKVLNASLFRSQIDGEDFRQKHRSNEMEISQVDRNLEDSNREIARLLDLKEKLRAFRDVIRAQLGARERQDAECDRTSANADRIQERFN